MYATVSIGNVIMPSFDSVSNISLISHIYSEYLPSFSFNEYDEDSTRAT